MDNDSEYIALIERTFTADQRKALADKGHALPDGSYPIETLSDLSNAIQAYGRATNPAAVKRHIIKRARALDATNMLPDDWQDALTEAAGDDPMDALQEFFFGLTSLDADDIDALSEAEAAALLDILEEFSGEAVSESGGHGGHGGAHAGHGGGAKTDAQGWATTGPTAGPSKVTRIGNMVKDPVTGKWGKDPKKLAADTRAKEKLKAQLKADRKADREAIKANAKKLIASKGADTAAFDAITAIYTKQLKAKYPARKTRESVGDLWASLTAVTEAGRVLSASNRHIVEQIRDHAKKLAHHPTAVRIEEMCEELLKATEIAEAKPTMGMMMGMMHGGMSDGDMLAKMVEMGMSEDEAKEMLAAMKAKHQQMAESTTIQIIEAAGKKDGREWDVILIQAGQSENQRYYPPETLKASAPLFEGVASYADHATDAERQARPERSIKDKVGKFTEAQYGQWQVRGRLVEGIKARFKVVSKWLKEALLEAAEAGEPDFYGFSIDAEGRVAKREHGGKVVNWVEAITKVHSVDVVTLPAAGGQIVRLVASKRNEMLREATGGIDMDPEEVKRLMQEAVAAAVGPLQAEITALKEVAPPPPVVDEETKKALAELKEAARKSDNDRRIDKALNETKLSEIGKARIGAQLREAAGRRDVPEDEIAAIVKEAIDYEAALLQSNANPVSRARMGDAGIDKLRKALEGMFEGDDVDGIPRFRSIKESYCRWTGADAFDVTAQEIHRAFIATRYDSAVDHKRIKESLQTSSWTDVYGDVMYVKLLKEYRASAYGTWRKVCSDIVDVSDFRTQHWVRVGGYADLSTVAEQGTYGELTSPGDEEIEFAVSKRGGLDDVTFEAIVNDRVGAIRRIPTNMARSAARTLYKFVFNLITTDNPTMDYDSVALYTSHNNSGTTALTLAGLNTAIIAMRDQTAYGESSEILGVRNYPKFCIVPNELEQRCNRIINPSGAYQAMILDSDAGSSNDGTGIDPEAFKGKGIECIVYDQLTDANDWFLVANPAEVNTVVMGFLNGQQEPELFVQDQPTVGSTFTADKISYKIRHIYGGDVVDHRSFYRNVVT